MTSNDRIFIDDIKMVAQYISRHKWIEPLPWLAIAESRRPKRSRAAV